MTGCRLTDLDSFFASLTSDYDVRVPVRLPDGTRIWGRFGDAPLALEGGPVPRRPTEIFFPQVETMFVAGEEGIDLPPPPSKPLLVAGLPACDVDALAFVDTFFAAGLQDDLYFARRRDAVLLGVSGRCAEDGTMLPRIGAGCDLELVCGAGGWDAIAYTPAGRRVQERIRGAEERREGRHAPGEPETGADGSEMLRRASELLLAQKVPDEFWQQVADFCIACTGCTLVCPTCTCFALQDRSWPGRVERSRLWDSCQLDGYAREASGHNPLGSEALRTRRRIHHKLAADVRRWGRISCVACGRCESACPTGVGVLSVAGEIVKRFG